MGDLELAAAGRLVPEAEDRIRRYCGLPWSGGPQQVWAYPYYDLIASTDPMTIQRLDVLACAALHPGLSRSDLEFFACGADALEAWLDALPVGLDLADADEATIERLSGLPELTDRVSLSLLSKVAHRKRPRLVPLLDREIVDWYRPVTRQRGAAAWPALLRAVSSDLRREPSRCQLGALAQIVGSATSGEPPSALRLLDIAIWMGGNR